MTKPHLHTVEHLLGMLAYHCRSMNETPAGRTHRSGIFFADVEAHVTVEIKRARWADDDDPNPDVWDQCTVNGRHEGNRCGAEKAIAAIYAPVIAAAAVYWAAQAAEPASAAEAA